ncbi:hypothetical protein LCGC14_1826880, partial [marine sediment metagenome]
LKHMCNIVDVFQQTASLLSHSIGHSRITYSYLVDQLHLQHEIESAMKQILRDANTTLVEGIKKTVELKLGEIVKSLKVSAG